MKSYFRFSLFSLLCVFANVACGIITSVKTMFSLWAIFKWLQLYIVPARVMALTPTIHITLVLPSWRKKNVPVMVWTILPFWKRHMSSPGLSCVYQNSFSLFSCYETLQLKPRLPQFITGGTKAKAVDKARQTNSNQLPLNTHITPLSALLTYK